MFSQYWMYFNARRFGVDPQKLKISIPPFGTPFLLNRPLRRKVFAIQESRSLGSLDWRPYARSYFKTRCVLSQKFVE